MGDRKRKLLLPPTNQKREVGKWATGDENPSYRPEIRREKRKSGRQEMKTPATAQKSEERRGKVGDRRRKPHLPPRNQGREDRKWATGDENPIYRPEIKAEKIENGRQETNPPSTAQKSRKRSGKMGDRRRTPRLPPRNQKREEEKWATGNENLIYRPEIK